jgi:outer membrane receptor protein involved in Fe transport
MIQFRFASDVRIVAFVLPSKPKKSGASPATLSGVILLYAEVLFSTTVTAQSAAVPSEELPEILVTAQKREQRAQDIAISISAVTGDEIDRLGDRDFRDILLSIPGVSYSGEEAGLSRYSIRGISTSASNPTVGIYLNDVSLLTLGTNWTGAVDPMLVDLERIEVLKGPQGTLYGGSAMGGAIKYVTRKPVLDHFAITAAGEIASVDHGGISYSGESFINLPLIQNRLALRLGGAYRFDAGYVDNIPAGQVQVWTRSATLPTAAFEPVTYSSQSEYARQDYNERRTTVGRVAAQYSLDDALTILPIATIQRSDQANPDEFFTNLPQFENTNRFNQPTRDDLNSYSLEVTKRLTAASLTALSGYVVRTIGLDRDFSLYIGSLFPALFPHNSYNTSVTTTRTWSQEVRLASAEPQSAWQWTLGAYYSRQRDEFDQRIDSVDAGAFFGTGTDMTYSGNQRTDTIQQSLFGDLTYTMSSQWDLNIGLRWFDIRQTINGVSNGVLNGGHSEVDDKRSTDVGVTPKYALAYRPVEGHLLYASASRGFRPGGPNQFDITSSLCEPSLQQLGLNRVPTTYHPDSLWTYELGSKNESSDRRTRINAAIYYTDWKKIQQQVTLMSCGFPFIGNVGAATVRGSELSAESTIGDRFTLGGAVSYTATRITQTGVGLPALVGQELLDTPKWMGNGYGEYRFLGTGTWVGSFRSEYQYHGANLRQFQSLALVTYPNSTMGSIPDATQIQAGYHVINTSLNVGHGPTQYRLYIDNLTDAAPYLDFRRAPGFSAADTLRPRTIGVGVKTTF